MDDGKVDPDFNPQEIYAPIRAELAAEIEAGGDGSLHTDEALELLRAMATSLARDVEISYDEYSSERGRDGEAHSLWQKRALPIFHQRLAETRERTESGEFLVRVTTRSDYRCRTVVIGEDEQFYIIYWRGSSRMTEHGSERGFRAVAVQPVAREELADLVGGAALARALAGLVVDRFADDWKPARTLHLEPRPQRFAGGDDERALFQLGFPPPDSCMALDPAGRLTWVAKPDCGFRRDDGGAEVYEPDPATVEPDPATVEPDPAVAEPDPAGLDDSPGMVAIEEFDAHAVGALERSDIDSVESPPEGW